MRQLIVSCCVVSGLSSIAAAGPDWTEIPDAGQLSGQTISISPVTSITGTLAGIDADGGADVVDLYRLRVPAGGAIVRAGGGPFLRGDNTEFDTVLFLFNQNGLGIFANDNAVPGTPFSELSIPSGGDFLLAISVRGLQPFSGAGNIFDIYEPQNITGNIPPNDVGGLQPLNRWAGTPQVQGDPGAYELNFTFPVPAPGSASLALLSLAALRRRSRR